MFDISSLLRLLPIMMEMGKFNPSKDMYDYGSAQLHGIQPDSSDHWQSRVPETGLLLKGGQNPTWGETVLGESLGGYDMEKRGDRWYSHNPVFEALEQNKGIPFVKRMYMENPPAIKNKDGSVSSHLMEWGEQGGMYYVYPTLVEKNGKLCKPEDPFGEALKTGNYIMFDDPKIAIRFAGGEWKNYFDKK